MRYLLLVVGVIGGLIGGCVHQHHAAKEPKILIGTLQPGQLFQEFPAYWKGAEQYQPDPRTLNGLKQLKKNYHVQVFLGTYCPDCKREVPRFLKIMRLLPATQWEVSLFGLERPANDKSGMREKYEIEFIPTFIIYEQHQEIGRIVERPMVSLEHDLLELCLTVEQE